MIKFGDRKKMKKGERSGKTISGPITWDQLEPAFEGSSVILGTNS